jgi:hypothetical protein
MPDAINREAVERFWASCKRHVLDAWSKLLDALAKAHTSPDGKSPSAEPARSRPVAASQVWAPPSDQRSWLLEEPVWFTAALTFGFLAIAEVLSWVMSDWPLCLAASQYHLSLAATDGESCATFSEGVFRLLGALWEHANAGVITAVAAVLIAVFTWTLWRSSEQMWRATNVAAEAAKRSADALMIAEQAQLIAVLGVSNIAHTLSELSTYQPTSEQAEAPKERVFVQYLLKNYGRTPAVLKEISHELQHWNRLPEELKYFPIPALPKELAIPAGANTESLQATLALPVTVEAARSISRGDSYLWLYGRAVYEDAFGRQREHRFLYRYRIGPGFQPYYYKDCNKTT